MTFLWIAAALLTGAACLAVMWPFLRRPEAAASGHDLEVYRDQLAEVDRDLARAAISPAEAEEAKAEIGRRILRAAEMSGASDGRSDSNTARALASTAVLAVPAVALGLYFALGSPTMPDQALETRLAANPAESSIDELIARAERHLVENPRDGRGWDVLAPIYLRVGRNEDAAIAFQNAIRLNGASAERESGLGDALYRAAGNIVTSQAQEAFERALEADGANPRARFYLALAFAQQDDLEQAALRWRSMLGDLPANSPWRGAAEQALARVEESIPSEAAPGPTAEDVQSAAELSAQDRDAMIEGMVAQLDQRLRDNPDDAAGWRRLIRSYSVLGRPDDARAALERGLDGLGADSEEGRALAEFAAGLDIEPRERQ